MIRGLIAALLALHTTLACALSVRFERVAENVYAYIGDTGGHSVQNQGLNANLGWVVTPQGAVLIDSGATWQSARLIDDAVRRVTTQPVRWVINTGGQDHRWLGNGYFRARGAELIAHASALPGMRSHGGEQLDALRRPLGAAAADARPELGGTVFELRHRGGGDTPGDTMV